MSRTKLLWFRLSKLARISNNFQVQLTYFHIHMALAFVHPPRASSHIIPHHISAHHIPSYHVIPCHLLCKANSSLCWFKFAEIKKSRCSHRVLWRGLPPEAWTSRRMNMWHAHTERHTSPQSDGADRLDSVIHLFDPIPLKVLRLCILHSTHQRNFNVHFCAANVPH